MAFGRLITGKSLPEALILASINPLYDNILFIKLHEKIQVEHMLCTQIIFVLFLLWKTRQFVYTTCAELVLSCHSMNNMLSHYVLIDARMRASDKDLPVKCMDHVLIMVKHVLKTNATKCTVG